MRVLLVPSPHSRGKSLLVSTENPGSPDKKSGFCAFKARKIPESVSAVFSSECCNTSKSGREKTASNQGLPSGLRLIHASFPLSSRGKHARFARIARARQAPALRRAQNIRPSATICRGHEWQIPEQAWKIDEGCLIFHFRCWRPGNHGKTGLFYHQKSPINLSKPMVSPYLLTPFFLSQKKWGYHSPSKPHQPP